MIFIKDKTPFEVLTIFEQCKIYFSCFLCISFFVTILNAVVKLTEDTLACSVFKKMPFYFRYNVEEEGGCDDLDQGDNGWKIIHTDVFRFPPFKSLLCAILGVGAQFLTLATGEPSVSRRHAL